MAKTTIEIENKDKKIIKYDVLFTISSDETNKNYIVYTDNKKDKDDSINAYAAIYDKSGKIYQIKDEKETKTLEELLNKFNEKGE